MGGTNARGSHRLGGLAGTGRDAQRSLGRHRSKWASKDAYGAAEWVAAMAPGAERDRSAGSLVFAIAEQFPREAWEWALNIGDAGERNRAATHAAKDDGGARPRHRTAMDRDGPFTPEVKAELQSALDERGNRPATLNCIAILRRHMKTLFNSLLIVAAAGLGLTVGFALRGSLETFRRRRNHQP